jgi:hypothetical protein
MSTRRFLATLAFLFVTGLWLGGRPRFQDEAWGLAEAAHVVIGLLACVTYLGYQLRHVAAKRGGLTGVPVVSGVLGALAVVAALASGALRVVEYRWTAVSEALLVDLHRTASWLVVGTVTTHALSAVIRGRVARCRVGRRGRRRAASEPSADPADALGPGVTAVAASDALPALSDGGEGP